MVRLLYRLHADRRQSGAAEGPRRIRLQPRAREKKPLSCAVDRGEMRRRPVPVRSRAIHLEEAGISVRCLNVINGAKSTRK